MPQRIALWFQIRNLCPFHAIVVGHPALRSDRTTDHPPAISSAFVQIHSAFQKSKRNCHIRTHCFRQRLSTIRMKTAWQIYGKHSAHFIAASVLIDLLHRIPIAFFQFPVESDAEKRINDQIRPLLQSRLQI